MSGLSTDNPQYESLVSNFLKVAVSQQMDLRGLRYAENPQLMVNFYINSQEKIRNFFLEYQNTPPVLDALPRRAGSDGNLPREARTCLPA